MAKKNIINNEVLTDRQLKFVAEYLVDLNATQAAIRAGYSPKTAGSIAGELLLYPKIVAEIRRRQAILQKETEITQANVINELAAIAFSDGTDFAKVVGEGISRRVEFTPTADLTAKQRKVIAGVKENQNGIEVKLHDKIRALELLGKYLGLFEQQQLAETGPSLADTVVDAYQRRKGRGE